MLIALAQHLQGLSDRQLDVRAGLSSSSGSFGTYLAKAYLSRLRTLELIEGRQELKACGELFA